MKQKSADGNALLKHLETFEGDTWQDTGRLCRCGECQMDLTNVSQYIPRPAKSGFGYIYDYSNVDVGKFLLRTYSNFMDRRWGGWSFHRSNDTNRNANIIKVWFDNNGYHSMPSYLSALNNAILQTNLRLVGVENASKYSE